MTNNLEEAYRNFKRFMSSTKYNVLFIFGPSGCGKHLLVEYALRLNGFPFVYASSSIT